MAPLGMVPAQKRLRTAQRTVRPHLRLIEKLELPVGECGSQLECIFCLASELSLHRCDATAQHTRCEYAVEPCADASDIL